MTMAAVKRVPAAGRAPWERENLRTASGHESKHLSAAQKASAERTAKTSAETP